MSICSGIYDGASTASIMCMRGRQWLGSWRTKLSRGSFRQDRTGPTTASDHYLALRLVNREFQGLGVPVVSYSVLIRGDACYSGEESTPNSCRVWKQSALSGSNFGTALLSLIEHAVECFRRKPSLRQGVRRMSGSLSIETLGVGHAIATQGLVTVHHAIRGHSHAPQKEYNSRYVHG